MEQAGQGGELIRAWLVCGTFSLFSSPLPLLFLSTLSLTPCLSISLSPSISPPSVSAKLKVCCGRLPGRLIHIKDTAIIYIMSPPILTQPHHHHRLLFSLLIPLTLTKAFSLILYFLLCLLHHPVFLSSPLILCCSICERQIF